MGALKGLQRTIKKGVSRRDDVIALADLARRESRLDGVIVGKALYEGRVDLADLLRLAA